MCILPQLKLHFVISLVEFKDFKLWCTVLLAHLNKVLNKAKMSLFKTNRQMALEAYVAFQVKHPPNSSSSWDTCMEYTEAGDHPLVLQRRKLGLSNCSKPQSSVPESWNLHPHADALLHFHTWPRLLSRLSPPSALCGYFIPSRLNSGVTVPNEMH